MTRNAERTSPVTVLMPVYNGLPHLMEAVQSVLDQTHVDLELLVLDDGSDDGSGEYLDDLSDPRVRIIHQPNRGLVATLNRGLAEATFPLVARMDADDVSAPERLAVQVGYLDNHQDVAAVGSCFAIIDDTGQQVDSGHVAADQAYLRRAIYARNVLAHGSVVMRRDWVVAVGGYRDVGPCEDYDLWVRLLAKHPVVNLADLLYHHRIAEAGISWRQRERQVDCFENVRADLHRAQPLRVTSPVTLLREGVRHVQTHPTCRRTAQSYASDHWILCLQFLRNRRVLAAGSVGMGLLMFTLRFPRALGGLPPATYLAGLRYRWQLKRRCRRSGATSQAV
jgi:hypothetical protein